MLLQRELSLNENYEVIVVGGGPSGCAAAIASARDGAKTLLIESTYCLGGMGTNGLVPFWCGLDNGGPLCSTGIGKTVIERAATRLYKGAGTPWGHTAIDAEGLKLTYDELVTEAGADVLFGTQCVGAETDGEGNVTALILANKRGLTAYRAKVYVDTTGDADLVAFAGGEYQLGDELGEMQAGTLCFTLSNVHLEGYEKINHTKIWPLPEGSGYRHIVDGHVVPAIIGENAVGFNAGHLVTVDGTDPLSVSENLLAGRQLAQEIVSRLKECFPEQYADAYLDRTATVLGVREGRRIRGLYTLTSEDYIARRDFPDEIARNCYNLDSHETKTERLLIAQGKKKAGSNERILYAPGESHGIPYRALLPEKLYNVIVAGRSISAERPVMGSIRVMGTCFSTGEAAGAAAAQAVREGGYNFHLLNTDTLRATLKRYGANIH